MTLTLRPFRLGDEAAARAAHRELAEHDNFPFLLGEEPGEPWSEYLDRREANRHGERLPERWVPSTFLAACVGGKLVGRISVRHELNDWLARYGGHIGYAVLPAHRRRGYASEILRQGVILARAVGIEDVLVICDDANIGSATVIERCGGVLEAVLPGEDGRPQRHYWIR